MGTLYYVLAGVVISLIIRVILTLFNVDKTKISRYTNAILLILFLIYMLRLIF